MMTWIVATVQRQALQVILDVESVGTTYQYFNVKRASKRGTMTFVEDPMRESSVKKETMSNLREYSKTTEITQQSINPLPKITHVAIIFEGKVYSLPAPNRHHHVIRHIVEVTGSKCVDGDEGFLDETGQFLKREPAKIRAEKTGQLKQQIDPHESLLFSEDLW